MIVSRAAAPVAPPAAPASPWTRARAAPGPRPTSRLSRTRRRALSARPEPADAPAPGRTVPYRATATPSRPDADAAAEPAEPARLPPAERPGPDPAHGDPDHPAESPPRRPVVRRQRPRRAAEPPRARGARRPAGRGPGPGPSPRITDTLVPDDDVVFLQPSAPTGTFPVVRPPAASGSPQPVWFRVVRRDGEPVPAAVVALLDDHGREVDTTKTAVDGGGELHTPHAGRFLMIVSADGYQPRAAILTVDERAGRVGAAAAPLGRGQRHGALRGRAGPRRPGRRPAGPRRRRRGPHGAATAATGSTTWPRAPTPWPRRRRPGRAVARLSLAEGADVGRRPGPRGAGPRTLTAMEHVDGRLAGVGGVELYWQAWLPGGAPRGVLLICPGMGEHSGRYATVVDDAACPTGGPCTGSTTVATAAPAATRVHVRRYADFLADFDTFRRAVVARHPGLRPFLLGPQHGRPDRARLRAGPPGRPRRPRALRARAAAPPVSRAPRAAVTPARPGGADVRRAVVDLSTISRDEAVVADYRADPLVHHGHPTIALSLRCSTR